MHVETTASCRCTPEAKHRDSAKCWRECKASSAAHMLRGWWERETAQLLRRTVSGFLKTWVMRWQCDPAVTFLGSCPRRMLCSHLYANIYGSFFVIYNQNLENYQNVLQHVDDQTTRGPSPAPPPSTTHGTLPGIAKGWSIAAEGHCMHSRRGVLNCG